MTRIIHSPLVHVRHHGPAVHMGMLRADPAHQRAVPIAFFSPAVAGDSAQPATGGWVESLANMGFNIGYVTDLADLGRAVAAKRPGIVCLSMNIDQLAGVDAARRMMAQNYPHSLPLTIAGGLGCVPQHAAFFDIAVVGEGDIILPRLLRLAQRYIARGKHSREEIVSALVNAEVVRRVAAPGGKLFSFAVPLAAGGMIYQNRSDAALQPRLDAVKSRWEKLYPQDPFPLKGRALTAALKPYPINSYEMDHLYGGFYLFDAVVTQRGCPGRCVFCYNERVQPQRGRHLSVDRVIEMIGRRSSSSRMMIRDDYFFQNPDYAQQLIDRIEKEGLLDRIYKRVQVRADIPMMSSRIRNLLEHMLGLGFFFEVGIETLDDERAEMIGKPLGKRASGRRYVGRALRFIELLAQTKRPRDEVREGDLFYLILTARGDRSLVPIARDIRRQLSTIEYMWRKHRYIPHMIANAVQLPGMRDQSTVHATGFRFAQPGRVTVIPKHRGKDVFPLHVGPAAGGVQGSFFVSAVHRDGTAEGVFSPDTFDLPPIVDAFARRAGCDVTPPLAARALIDTYLEHRSSVSAGERAAIEPILDDIESLLDCFDV